MPLPIRKDIASGCQGNQVPLDPWDFVGTYHLKKFGKVDPPFAKGGLEGIFSKGFPPLATG